MDQSNINIKEGGKTEERKKKGETDRKQTLRQTERQTERPTDRETNRHCLTS